MTKTYSSPAISYGAILPALPPADGALFFKTSFDADGVTNPPGLYVFMFQEDMNIGTPGDQVGTGWKSITSSGSSVVSSFNTRIGAVSLTTADVTAVLGGAPGTGSVTSVGIAVGSTRLSVSGSPVTSAGIINLDVVEPNLNLGNMGGLLSLTSQVTGTLPISHGGTNIAAVTVGGVLYGATASQYGFTTVGSAGQLLQSNASSAPTWVNPSAITAGSALTVTESPSGTQITFNSSSVGGTPGGVWGSNDGVNMYSFAPSNFSVSNATTVAGYSVSAAATANTVALRDGSGYLFAAYLNTTASTEVFTPSTVLVSNGSDTFIRRVSLATLSSSLGVGNYLPLTGGTMTGTVNFASGSLEVNGSNVWTQASLTNLSQLTNGPGYITSAAVSSSYLPLSGGTLSGSLTVTGTIQATGDVLAYASDARLKKNVSVIQDAVQKVGTLGGYEYDWDLEKTRRLGFQPTNPHEHGLIAQEVQKVMPDAVGAAPFNGDYLTVKYERLVALLVAAVNEQQKTIEELREEVNSLTSLVRSL